MELEGKKRKKKDFLLGPSSCCGVVDVVKTPSRRVSLWVGEWLPAWAFGQRGRAKKNKTNINKQTNHRPPTSSSWSALRLNDDTMPGLRRGERSLGKKNKHVITLVVCTECVQYCTVWCAPPCGSCHDTIHPSVERLERERNEVVGLRYTWCRCLQWWWLHSSLFQTSRWEWRRQQSLSPLPTHEFLVFPSFLPFPSFYSECVYD